MSRRFTEAELATCCCSSGQAWEAPSLAADCPLHGAPTHPETADAIGCSSCGEEMPRGECPKSPRECGHHCNHSWSHEVCHWCGMEWGPNDEATKEHDDV